MSDRIAVRDLFAEIPAYMQPLFDGAEYPWELLPRIRSFIDRLLAAPPPTFREILPGVLAEEGVEIADTATILPPAVLGAGTAVRPGAFLRGYVLTGQNCVLGNSSEFKNCILLDRVQAPHYNYVGDSVLGHHAHLGAGAVCSNLKADGKEVVIHGQRDYETGLRKLGGILGDKADIGCGCVLNPGTVVGCRTSVYPLTALRGVYPADSIVKSATETVRRR